MNSVYTFDKIFNLCYYTQVLYRLYPVLVAGEKGTPIGYSDGGLGFYNVVLSSTDIQNIRHQR